MSILPHHAPARATAVYALLGLFLLAAALPASTGKLYRYDVDLVNITRDKFKVTLHNEGFAADILTYHFPKVIPGTYQVADYGKYIRRFRAWDNDGRRLKVKRRGWNTFRIQDARHLATITYWVNDTWDARFVRNDVYPMAGTNIDLGKNMVINAGGVFGYFEGEEQNPVEATFSKLDALYAMTVLPRLADNGREVTFRAENYHQLVDSPIMFAPADTLAFRVKNTRITIGVDAATSSANHAQQYYSFMAPAMTAIGAFLDTLPVNDYAFLIYLSDMTALGRIAVNPRFEVLRLLWYLLTNGLPILGALEHNTSSFYHWVDAGPEFRADVAESMVSEAAIHEFMHIVTPLTLHSQHVGDFNYADPVMSKHLWLYEGVTEYFARLIPVRAGFTSPKEFILADIRGKIRRGERFPNEKMSFTEMSANVFHRPYQQQFGQVYQRGAALGMLLDIEIIRLTDGEKTLISVLQELSRRYGASRSFDEDTFIEEFVAGVHPDLQQFFDSYISGREELPYATILDHMGVEYVAEVEEMRPRHPIFDNDVKRALVGFGRARRIKRAKAGNFAGLKVGDLVKSASYRDQYMDDFGNYVAEGTQIDFPVVRDGVEITLPITVEYMEATTKHRLRILEDMSPNQDKYYRIWLGLEPATAQAPPPP